MPPTSSVHDVVVIGAGLAGLTAAYELKQRGIAALVLEKEKAVGLPWARRHPQLTLNTHRTLSSLPGLKYPSGTGAFPRRDAVIAHLRAFRDKHQFAIEYEVDVLCVQKRDDLFLIDTTVGTVRARHLIVATGRDAGPNIPPWKGLQSFTGELVHAADFGDAQAYAGKTILVVGGGNSGFDVLNHLSRVDTRKVWFSVRRQPGLLPKRLGRFAVHRLSPLMAMLPSRMVDHLIAWTQRIAFGNLSRHGFPPGPADAATRLARDNVAIAVDDGAIAAIRRGHISVVPEILEFAASRVMLSDGLSVEPDVVIAAVGYRSGLTRLLAPLAMTDREDAVHVGVEAGAASNLWFVGMKPSLTSYFHQARREARSIARSISSMPHSPEQRS